MKIITLLLLMAITFLSSHAQKLPNVQQVGLRAPANVEVDGKANEWGIKLQAHNTATDVYYTIANDDKKLYLIIQASGSLITNIANGGIRLAIQKTGRKNDAEAPFVKYPYLEKGKRILINTGDFNGGADTTVMRYNKQLTTNAKWIYTKGFNGVDSLLSVYNDSGIAAAGTFNNEMKYTLEMAVDLSLLGLSFNQVSKFSYHFTINGEPNSYSHTNPLNLMKRVISNNNWPVTEKSIQNMEAFENFLNKWAAPTDFWGEYTLAK